MEAAQPAPSNILGTPSPAMFTYCPRCNYLSSAAACPECGMATWHTAELAHHWDRDMRRVQRFQRMATAVVVPKVSPP